MNMIRCDVCGEFHGSDYNAYTYLSGILKYIPEKNYHVCRDCAKEMASLVEGWYHQKTNKEPKQEDVR